MALIEIEEPLGIWTRFNVTPEERRRIIAKAEPERRFIHDGVVYIAHSNNAWCWFDDKTRYIHMWNHAI